MTRESSPCTRGRVAGLLLVLPAVAVALAIEAVWAPFDRPTVARAG